MPPSSDEAAKLPLAPALSSGMEPRRSGSRGRGSAAEGAPIKPLDVETTAPAATLDAKGRSALDRRIDTALLPCLCMISIANFLGEVWLDGFWGRGKKAHHHQTSSPPPSLPPLSPDRNNVAFAVTGMRRDVGITLAQYGVGSSILFATYCGAQVPMSLIGARFGLTRTLAAACVVWGITAASMASINSVGGFYAARLALGLAEAPTYPLIITYLRTFHHADVAVGASYSYVHAAALVASVIGGPIAAGVLAMEGEREEWEEVCVLFLFFRRLDHPLPPTHPSTGLAGLAGWRWLFLIEGILPIVVGVWVLFLPASPATAKFLTPDERARVAADVATARPHAAADANSGRALMAAVVTALTNWRLVAAGSIEMINSCGRWAAQLFTPLIIDEILTGEKPPVGKPAPGHGGGGAPKPAKTVILAALLSAIPFGLAAASSVLNGWGAKRANSTRGWGRRWFIVWPSWVCAAGLYAVGPLLSLPPSSGTRAGAFIAIIAALQGFALWGPVMSLPSTLTSGSTAAAAVSYALFVALGTLGGLIGPAVLGETTQRTASYTLGGAVLGSLSAVMGLVWAVAFGFIVPGGL